MPGLFKKCPTETARAGIPMLRKITGGIAGSVRKELADT